MWGRYKPRKAEHQAHTPHCSALVLCNTIIYIFSFCVLAHARAAFWLLFPDNLLAVLSPGTALRLSALSRPVQPPWAVGSSSVGSRRLSGAPLPCSAGSDSLLLLPAIRFQAPPICCRAPAFANWWFTARLFFWGSIGKCVQHCHVYVHWPVWVCGSAWVGCVFCMFVYVCVHRTQQLLSSPKSTRCIFLCTANEVRTPSALLSPCSVAEHTSVHAWPQTRSPCSVSQHIVQFSTPGKNRRQKLPAIPPAKNPGQLPPAERQSPQPKASSKDHWQQVIAACPV